MSNKKFIVIDGPNFVGKTSIIEELKARLGKLDFKFTREPGGTKRAERIREVILDKELGTARPITDLLCFFAARAEHMTAITHWLKTRHVITDRFDSSTYAFQVHDWSVRLRESFAFLRDVVVIRKPDLYIILTAPVEVLFERRRRGDDEKGDRFDEQTEEEYTRASNGFAAFAKNYARGRHLLVDATKPFEEVVDVVERAIVRTIHDLPLDGE